MKRTLLFLIAMVLTCVGLQAQDKIQKSTSLPEEGTEYLYLYQMKNGNGAYVGAGSAYGGTNAKLAFYESSTAGRYQIYDCTSRTWWTYTQKSGDKGWFSWSDIEDPYTAGENFVTTCANKSDAKEFIIENYSGNYYQIKPYYSSGDVPSIYLNYYSGPSNGERLGLWTDNGSKDGGSRWMFELVQQAQAPETSISSINNLSNDKLYVLRTKRNGGEVVYNSTYSSAVCWNGHSTSSSISYSKTDARFQWAIYKSAHTGNYYIYSIAGGKFFGTISENNAAIPLVSNITNAVEIKQRSTVTNYPFMMSVNGSGIVNASPDHNYGLINWADGYNDEGDEGSAFAFIEAGDLSNEIKSIIEDKVAEFEGTKLVVESGKLYRIKNRCTDLSYSTINRGDGNGAYLSSTYTKSSNYNDNVRDIHCATTSKADAGCVWMFEGSNTEGWAIKNMNNGLYIDDERGKGTSGNAYLYVKLVEGRENAARFTITKNSDGYWIFFDSDYNNSTKNYLHAAGAGLQIWTANADDYASHWEIIPATELEVTLNGGQTEDDASTYANWASLHLPFAVAMPDGVTANKASISAEAGTVTLEPMSGEIPANTGMILRAASATNATLTILSESEISNLADVDNNALSGTNVEIALDGTNNAEYYVLGKGKTNERVGLRNPSSSVTKIPMNRAYYHTTNPQMNMLMFVLGETTGIDNVKEAIMNNTGDIYDLSGRKVLQPLKGGIYIQNGKKFIKR